MGFQFQLVYTESQSICGQYFLNKLEKRTNQDSKTSASAICARLLMQTAIKGQY